MVFKVWGSAFQERGVPDIIGCYQGRYIGIEAKRPKPFDAKFTDAQKRHINAINKADGFARVCYGDWEEIEQMLDMIELDTSVADPWQEVIDWRYDHSYA